ncbi:OB-fold nucleic acid binding domain-containing protein [Propionibacterium freudenreichii]|uniref:OB-fold nucleic acid binding domain-containing protein n=1 Tax=Propionibacterium freudenreichii TaxID=1744 RepID=UPI000BEF13D3|nr:OB-fold nucleic acid binding domain-containing protein [Propionibacterium freudenreichii]
MIAIDLHGRTQTDLELQELGVAISDHRMTRFHPLFRELGVTPARSLIDLPGGTKVLVASVRRATNTPPMRNGRRTIFVTLDDGTAVVNLAFFADAQERIRGPVLFTDYLLVRGTTRRSGARGISVTGQMAWDLTSIAPHRLQRGTSEANSDHERPAAVHTALVG